jgi:hypothetical protein
MDVHAYLVQQPLTESALSILTNLVAYVKNSNNLLTYMYPITYIRYGVIKYTGE